MIKVSGLIHKRPKTIYPRLSWTMLQNAYLINGDFNKNKKEILRCFSQVCQEMFKLANKTTKFKAHGIIWTTTNIC